MTCINNCESEDLQIFDEQRDINYCKNCIVDSAKNRYGEIFKKDEEVEILNYHPRADGRIFIIREICKMDGCESGTMIFLKDKDSGKSLKHMIDVNWLIKHKS